jgi:hypothetical protein
MRSLRSKRFKKLYAALPAQVQRDANQAYMLFRQDPSLPGLEFKRIQPPHLGLVSARISSNYRVIGLQLANGDIVWDWIGTHTEYMRLLP